MFNELGQFLAVFSVYNDKDLFYRAIGAHTIEDGVTLVKQFQCFQKSFNGLGCDNAQLVFPKGQFLFYLETDHAACCKAQCPSNVATPMVNVLNELRYGCDPDEHLKKTYDPNCLAVASTYEHEPKRSQTSIHHTRKEDAER